jgi:hypothetical protein
MRMKVRKQTIRHLLKVTAFIFCTMWWGGLNCLASCVASEVAKATGACEMDCCAVQESEESQDFATPGFRASLQTIDCCALQELAAQETAQAQHFVPLVAAAALRFSTFLPATFKNHQPTFSCLSLPDKSNLQIKNCVWRI